MKASLDIGRNVETMPAPPAVVTQAEPLIHQHQRPQQHYETIVQSRDRSLDRHTNDNDDHDTPTDNNNGVNHHHPSGVNESTRLLIPSSCIRSTVEATITATDTATNVSPRRQRKQQKTVSSKESRHPYSHSTIMPARTSAVVLWCIAIGGLCLLLVVMVILRVAHSNSDGGEDSWWWWWTTGSNIAGSTTREYDGMLQDELFDYIVVGAGPAGIITAVSLARLLPNQTILLVEAGTTSQASVLSRVQEHTWNQRRSHLQQQQPRQTPSQTKEAFETPCSSSQTTTIATASTSLNEFDVPLLWSGVAASTGGALRSTESVVLDSGLLSHSSSSNRRHRSSRLPLPPQPIHDHHWPIGRTLLGKNIGGSGIQNAMIYIRSLSADWNQWNISGWDYDRDILPVYQELERYHHGSADDETVPLHSTTSEGRGRTGPITTTPVDMNLVDAVAPLFVESAIQAGIPSRVVAGFNADDDDNVYRRGGDTASVDDLNKNSKGNTSQPKSHPRVGVGYYEFNIRHGVRDSVARAFLGDSNPAPLPDNLWIESGVTVTRVLFEDDESTLLHGTSSATPPSSDKQTRRRPLQRQSNRNDERPPTLLQSKIPRVVGVEYVRTVFTDITTVAKRNRVGQFLLRRRDDDTAPNRCEVILAAGAIMTPQLLVNSGIGDNSETDTDQGGAQSITNATTTTAFRVHLPGVGKNLQDHPVVTMGFEIDAELALMGSVSSIYTIGSEMDEYFWAAMELNRLHNLNQSMSTELAESSTTIADLTLQLGTLGTPGFSAGCFLRSPFSAENDTTPDIQITVFPRHMEPHVTRQTQRGKRDYLRLLRNKAMLVTVALLKPEARFEVKTSRSSIPLVPWDDQVCEYDSDETIKRVRSYRLPAIDLPDGVKRYLTERDIQRLAWGLEEVRRIQSMAPLANHIGPEMYPGAKVRGKELWDYIRSKSLPNAHWAGTTRMSSDANDMRAVVDERLRVRYVDGLRIVDAGVLPTVPNGNLHSTVCVIAHRAASLIAHDRQRMENRANDKDAVDGKP